MASIEKRSDNSYRIIVSKPKPNGKGYVKERKTVTLSPKLTEKQKEKELDKLALLFEEEVKSGNYLDGEKMTLTEFVDIWMRDYAEKELAPSTLVHYKMRLEKRILPALGHLKLAQIQPNHITAFYNNLKETGIRMDVLYKASDEFLKLIEGRSQKSLGEQIGVERHVFARLRKGKCVYYETARKICAFFNINQKTYFIQQDTDKILSAKSVHHHHTLLSGIFSMAVAWNVLKDNPALRVRLPSVTKAKSAQANFYNDEQVVTLFVALEDEPIKYKTIIYLAIDTGLRLSEVAGLTWDLLDLNEQVLNVVQQRQYISSEYGIVEGDPKSDSGIRSITISGFVRDKMLEYKRHHTEMRLKCGSAWHQSDYIFTHEDGKPIFPRRPSVWFTEFIKRRSLPHITFHGLRHTNASLMISGDTDIATVSGRLGHADKNVTLNIYTHMIKSREKMVANKMDQYYEGMNSIAQLNAKDS